MRTNAGDKFIVSEMNWTMNWHYRKQQQLTHNNSQEFARSNYDPFLSVNVQLAISIESIFLCCHFMHTEWNSTAHVLCFHLVWIWIRNWTRKHKGKYHIKFAEFHSLYARNTCNLLNRSWTLKTITTIDMNGPFYFKSKLFQKLW